MDSEKARLLEGQLKGKLLEAWRVGDLIDHGKSAAVFHGHSDGQHVAVKIFDDELILRYGDKTQIERIERELSLTGTEHPNLVKILGGGFSENLKSHFIVMEYVEGDNLKKSLNKISADKIPELVAQLTLAAKHLFDLGFVHRDIKPENVAIVNNFTKAVLLDLGVMRPVKGSDLTDADGIQSFVGTLQYSSPEFLLREEEDSEAGWKALTFYQIGGIIHDLAMQKPLFSEHCNPYSRLVNAVQHSVPVVHNSALPTYLIEAAKLALLKDWRIRAQLLDWDSFLPPAPKSTERGSAKQRVTNRVTTAIAAHGDLHEPRINDDTHRKALLREAMDYLAVSARNIRSENAALPPIRIKRGEDRMFGISFSETGDFGLKEALTIWFSVEIVDLSAKIISLSSCHVLGLCAAAEVDNSLLKKIYAGSLDGSLLYDALDEAIYASIEAAQSESAGLAD